MLALFLLSVFVSFLLWSVSKGYDDLGKRDAAEEWLDDFITLW
jgi:nitrogen fixation-related uncharacterized protein